MSYYSEHKDYFKSYMKEYRKTEQGKEVARKTYLKNKASILAKSLINTKNWRLTEEGKKKFLISSVRSRAKKLDIPFNLTKDDLDWPSHCPVLGIELNYAADINNRQFAPSLDRIIPSLGYVVGNVKVISYRANMLKNSASTEEVEKILNYLRESV